MKRTGLVLTSTFVEPPPADDTILQIRRLAKAITLVAPGHPIALARLVLAAYDNPEASLSSRVENWTIWAARDLVRDAVRGRAIGVAAANRLWASKTGWWTRWRGQRQADRLTPALFAHASWLAQAAPRA